MAASISNIAVVVNGQTIQLQSAMTQGAKSIDTVSRASTKLNADLMEQRRVFRALNPAITANDKAMDRHVENARALTVIFGNLEQKTNKFTASVQQLAHWHQESAKRMRLYPTGYIGGGFGAVSGVDMSRRTAELAAFNKGVKNTQLIAQQGVFAIDDFFASFQTGGVAGGLRGAANNLTMMAAILGNIKFQLGAIAAIAGVQLVLGAISRERVKLADEMAKKLAKLREELDMIANRGTKDTDTAFAIIDAKKIKDAEEASQKIGENLREQIKQGARIRDAQAALERAQTELAEAKLNIADPHGDWRVESGLRWFIDMQDELVSSLEEEVENRQKAVDAAKDELDILRQIGNAIPEPRRLPTDWLQDAMDAQDFWRAEIEAQDAARKGLDAMEERLQGIINPKEAGVNKIMKQLEDDLAQIREAVSQGFLGREDASARIDMLRRAAEMELRASHKADMSAFGRFPGIDMMGSAGAISSINQSAYGSQNLRDQQRALKAEETTAAEVRRMRELLEKSKNDIVGVTI